MSNKPKVIVIEDRDGDRREVFNVLADSQFCEREDVLGMPSTYEDALALLNEKAEQVDVVFLDLNLPRNDRDARPERGHGQRLLGHIQDLNRQKTIDMRVIVVSAETLAEDWDTTLLRNLYGDMLVGIVQKAALAPMLKASLKRLRRDEFRARIRRAKLAILDEYDTVFDSSAPIRERLKDAKKIAICLVRNDYDYHADAFGASAPFADKLHELLRELESRFTHDPRTGRRNIDAAFIQSPGGWGAFLWRGSIVQHLYIINNYRNDYEHLVAKPFRSDGRSTDTWVIPPSLLDSTERGECVGKVVELVLREVLEWYLPWHEQVYLPWFAGQGGTSS